MNKQIFCRAMLLAILTGIVSLSPCNGQLFSTRIDKKHIPNSACMSATVFPKKIAGDPKYDLFPREIVTAWGQKEFGFDPMLLNQLTFVADAPKGLAELQMGPPNWCMILHFDELQGVSGRMVEQLRKGRIGDHILYSNESEDEPSILIYDEVTMFIGNEPMFEGMLNSNGKTNLVQMMKSTRSKGDALAFVDAETARPFLNELFDQLPPFLPPDITKLKQLPNMLEGVELVVGLEDSLETKVILHFIDDESASKGEKIIANAMDLGKELAIGGAATQFDLSDKVQEATLEYIQRMANEYQTKLAPSTEGDQVTIAVSNEAAAAPFLIGMLLPAMQQTRAAARRTQSMNNMRQMTLAAHNYASANGGFPAQASYDKNGKPLLSWRVHVLPYIEQQELYEQFRLDEPWDSPHNRKLIDKMPPSYRSPSSAAENGKTVYLGVAGEGGLFGPKMRNFSEITDGTSNTVMMIEVNDSMAVEWTKPQDYEMNPRNPMQGLGGQNPGGFNTTFADGSSRFISSALDPELWKGMLTINGGEVPGRY
ncbi:MAG: DUF1559 domain-containing protein [Planctomycetota bacterium]